MDERSTFCMPSFPHVPALLHTQPSQAQISKGVRCSRGHGWSSFLETSVKNTSTLRCEKALLTKALLRVAAPRSHAPPLH